MKLSKFICELQRALHEHGDVVLFARDSDNSLSPVKKLDVMIGCRGNTCFEHLHVMTENEVMERARND